MEKLNTVKQEWLGNVRADVLAGIVVALALIPEAIAFSLIAGLNPMVGLYASFIIAMVISITGGRPAMISAATGAMVLLVVDLVRDYGLQYLLAAGILAGIIQIVLGFFGIARLMKFIPRAVMVGFVNALAILIFQAQLPNFEGESWIMWAIVAASLVIIFLFPRITGAIPAPLVAIVAMTLLAVFMGLDTKNIGDLGTISATLPEFLFPDVPFTLETLMIILPYAFSLAFVGLIESLLTAQIVDDMTGTDSNKNRESKGQGIANIIAGFFGAMPGCAMIGQSVINVSSGARGRLSTFVAGLALFIMIMTISDVLMLIPVGALVGVMFFVSYATFDWGSLKALRTAQKSDTVVMLVTVLVTVLTHDLSIGVFAGILTAAILFAAKISKVELDRNVEAGHAHYVVNGQLFFASTSDFVNQFDVEEDIEADIKHVTINFSNTHLWDDSAIGAIDKVVFKYRANGIEPELLNLNKDSEKLLNTLALHLKQQDAGIGH
ncbi:MULTISPECIES: SulP family inorganic anion transporter [unclassified Exiguobacterium]|uniref:SulP family inorganic anion transporter n=1 Tax=unclassified Exiguobacterium TaxID=2644629 RepID=UPI0009FEE1FD|nr:MULTISPECIES: SulP family inorganic anion transporter [unclassified Exiguobacterium]TCI68168.1 SulP family inorganic anion transporter [Exiguobacterium sp. SH0S7]